MGKLLQWINVFAEERTGRADVPLKMAMSDVNEANR